MVNLGKKNEYAVNLRKIPKVSTIFGTFFRERVNYL